MCTTLFDVTRTNVNARRTHLDSSAESKQRQQQSNFETILQIISMRAQPENVTDPEKIMTQVNSGKWGTNYKSKNKIPMWKFEFEVEQSAALSDGQSELGNLFKDSHGIPVLTGLEEWPSLGTIIDSSDEFRNIYFEVVEDGSGN